MDTSVLELGHVHLCKKGFQSQIKNKMANSIHPDEMVPYEQSSRSTLFAEVSVLVCQAVFSFKDFFSPTRLTKKKKRRAT